VGLSSRRPWRGWSRVLLLLLLCCRDIFCRMREVVMKREVAKGVRNFMQIASHCQPQIVTGPEKLTSLSWLRGEIEFFDFCAASLRRPVRSCLRYLTLISFTGFSPKWTRKRNTKEQVPASILLTFRNFASVSTS